MNDQCMSRCIMAKVLWVFLLFWPFVSVAGPIGFEQFYPPPYPVVPNHPQPEFPAYPLNYNDYGSGAITACGIPAGTYRVDVKNIARTEQVSINKLVLYLHVNDAGLMVMRLKLKPNRGREEEYVVIPYWGTSDVSNICNGVNFSFFFNGVSVYEKTLSGNLSGQLSSYRWASNHSLTIDGLLERYDAFYNSRVSVNLMSQQMDYVYSYLK